MTATNDSSPESSPAEPPMFCRARCRLGVVVDGSPWLGLLDALQPWGRVELLLLSRERLDHLMEELPELAAALFRLLVIQMAGRVEQLGMQANELAR